MDDAPSDQDTVAGELATRSDVDVQRATRDRDTARVEPRLARGDEVGRYVILERLGAGGMGVVHAAWDPKLDRKVALKLLHSDKQDHGQRLEREAQAMARLTHPNVIAVHDVGEVDGRVFVAMEFVDGQTLSAWAHLATARTEAAREAEHEPRPRSEILEVLLAAGRGLAAAHEQGLVHRDFKPDNVMVGADGRVRVMDFGLVRDSGATRASATLAERIVEVASVSELEQLPHMHASIDGASAFESQLTRASALLGTPADMAPEQLRGDEADARADQFARSRARPRSRSCLRSPTPSSASPSYPRADQRRGARAHPSCARARSRARSRRALARHVGAAPRARR